MLKTKLFLILAALSLVLFIGIALAQENEGTNSATTEEEITAQDLGVSEPRILPGNPFYFLKEWARTIQSTFTFDAVSKAKLKEKFSNEKLIELKKLIEEKKNQKIIEKGIENYKKGVEEIKTATDKIKEKAEESTQVGKFLDKFVQQQVLQQRILQKLQTQVGTSTFEKIQEAREQHLERFGEVMNKLETSKEKAKERLEQILEKISTSTLQKLSTPTQEKIIQIRDRIIEKVEQRNVQGTTTGACITLWDPVCGENSRTYSNECFAKLAGIEVTYKGKCEEKQCQTDADCPQPKCLSTDVISAKCSSMQTKCVEGKCQIVLTKTQPSETCENLCGDGICQEVVCLAIGCPCPETRATCSVDCK